MHNKQIYEPRRDREYRGSVPLKARPSRRDNLTGLHFRTEDGKAGTVKRYAGRGFYLTEIRTDKGKMTRLVHIQAMSEWEFEDRGYEQR
jgi:hypothetical protein